MRVEDRLRRAAAPDALVARERARRVVLAAAPAPIRRRGRSALLVLLVIALTGLALTPPGEALARWLRDLVEPRPAHAPAARIEGLPSRGRLLAAGPQGTFLIDGDGRWRRIGSYSYGVWSPRGLFVAVVDGRRLRAIEPDGTVRWTLEAAADVSDPRWSPTGYRIVYRRDDDLRVVAGDGSGDHPLVDSVAAVPAAWRPGAGNQVAVARRDGAVELWEADTGRRVWRRSAGDLRSLAWTPSGRLVAVTTGRLLVLGGEGRVLMRRALVPRVTAAALSPDGSRLALARDRVVAMLALRDDARERVRLVVEEVAPRITWDGGTLLAASGDQWYLVPASGGPVSVTTARGPSGGFSPVGWCCAQGTVSGP